MRKAVGLLLLANLTFSIASAATFDEQRKAVSASPATQSEAAIISLLKAGIAQGQPTQAITETRKWLRQNLPEDADLLYQAGRAAELSGDARGAAALYQQYLKKTDPKAEHVFPAVIAVHILLRDQLNDPNAAYSFNRSVGDRLAANPVSRQFDEWFLGEAMKRRDAVAIAKRLRALIQAGVPVELLTTHHAKHFRWLLAEVDSYIQQGRKAPVTAELVSTYKELTAAMSFDEEMTLRLDWAVSVRAYNLSRVGDDGSQRTKKGKKDKSGETETTVADEEAPPIAQAEALLAKYPQYALWVQDGWAGGGNGQHYRNDPAKYWPHELDAKMAPIVAAAAKLSPLQLADLVQSWRHGHYADRYVRPLQVEAVRDYLTANPELMSNRVGVLVLEKEWNKLTPAEARELAPIIAGNPDPEAALIRAIAAGGEAKDLDKMIDALIGPEAWRLGPAELDGRYADQLWHYAGRPDGSAKRDQKIRESKAVSERIKAAAPPVGAPPKKRLGLFRKLWADYRSAQPKIPGVISQLTTLLKTSPEAVAELLKDPSADAQRMARKAIADGITGADPVWKELEGANRVDVTSYAPGILYLAQRHASGSIPELKRRHPQKAVAYPLEPDLRQVVAAGLKSNKLEPWQVLAWINMQYSEDNAEQVQLAKALAKSPLWNQMPFEVRFGAREWFRDAVMTPAEIAMLDAANPALACEDLLALNPDAVLTEKSKKKGKKKRAKKPTKTDAADEEADPVADLNMAAAALQSTMDNLLKSPVRIEVPEPALEGLAMLHPAVFRDPMVQAQMLGLIDELKAAPPAANFGYRLIDTVAAKPDPVVIHRVAPFFWQHINRHSRAFPTVKTLTQNLVDTHPSAASALARTGLEAIARHRGHSYYDRDVDVPLLKSIRGNAAMKMGLIVIPVARNHPAYPVYQSQGDWITGNEDSAWDRLDEHWDAFLPIQRELSMPYLKWVLQRVIYSRNEVRQEELIKTLLAWAREAGSPLTPAEKAEIDIAYGDIAMQRGQLRQAHEIYTRTQDAEEYRELPIRHQATLRKAAAERIAKNFDGALQTLNELELERVPGIWTDTRYARAMVYFDMEEFDDSKDDIDSILARDPTHADARILLGKVQLKLQKLMEATEVELGSASAQKTLVPGEKLKVTLTDPTLAVSGAGTEIEVVVWAVSGDRETFFLRQFGDQKTKFRGELATSLGAPAPGDDTLQVIGDDEIFYAYSERFREKMNGLEEKRGGPITVASDAILMASARKLLSEAEQRTADMEALMEEIKGRDRDRPNERLEASAKARMAARSLDAEARAEDAGFSESEFERFLSNVTKPGKPIHVRVIDPDRSRTAEIDELTVSVGSSSGDSVARVTLKETGTHTGWFEGSIPTTGAQALAFARESEPGRNPNMVISPAADTYPAWRPVANKDVTPEFKVDLNDNVALGELTITAAEAGAKLQTFALQTGMNEQDMTTVAVFPQNQAAIAKPWHPSVVVMNDTDHHHNRDERSVYDLRELREHLERGWITQQYQAGAAGNVAGPSEAMTETIPGKVKWLRQNRHHNSHIVYRFRGYFHEPREVTRRFKVELGKYQVPEKTHPSVAHPPQFLLAVNGRPITNPEQPKRLEGEINLRPGLHSFEIWATGWDCTIGFGRTVKLLANLEDPDVLVDCPDRFFDPATFPANSMDHRNGPATVTANSAGTEFTVKFAPGSRARLLKLVLLKHEGAVPALNTLVLAEPDGKRVLPVAEDFATLNKNDTLEILTGDKISVRYLDDRFVTDARERLERFLNVSFTDARTEFADMEPRFSGKHGKDMPYYEKLLRFPHDAPLSLAIHDADMDVTIEPDTVQVTLKSDGGSREFTATETGDSTGVFKLTITPVAGAASGDEQLQVAEGGTITATYLDKENNRPGVPTERIATIQHAAFSPPRLVLSHAEVREEEIDTWRTLIHGFERRDYRGEDRNTLATERVQPRWLIENTMRPADEGDIAAVHGRTMFLELIAPHLALGTASKVTVYAQTDAGRRQAAADGAPNAPFNISVPGTIALNGGLGSQVGPGDWRMVPSMEIYHGGGIPQPREPLTDRFKLSVPLIAGPLPPFGVLSEEERAELKEMAKTSRSTAELLTSRTVGLVVQPGERIHFGFKFTDKAGHDQWLTASTKVITHPVFDIMAEDYRAPITSAYVGETLNLRVVDLGADTSDQSDVVTVLVQAKSGAKHRVELRETGPHTGIFKAGYALSYAKARKNDPPADGEEAEPYKVRRDGFPVVYGDTIAARYTDPNGVKTQTSMVTISKGADGSVEPFSKIYEDEEMAMRTQFSLAEAYLEMAKRHRKLGQSEAAEIEYASAKQLLSKAMDQFTDPETRAHAEYLLGTLTMEEADNTPDAEMRETRYRAALSRFLKVTGSYPQTLHASKAQYRIATVYERLKEPDIAAQEYVKLAYKYPDSEFLATSMARLGTHFLKKAAAYESKSRKLLAKGEEEEDKDALYEGEAMQKMAALEYIKTARIFARLQERFPGNDLAGQAGLRAGQAYMRANRKQEAVDAFQRVMAEQAYDGPKVRAQAMYWIGMCYLDLRQQMAAYSAFKRLTYDFPESHWAAYARGQLSQESLLKLETELELERLEEGR